MSKDETTTPRSRFGVVGLDVGMIGRWLRLGFGVVILAPLITESVQAFGERGVIPLLYTNTLLYFALIVIAYVVVYYALGERLFATANAWLNTLILVGPAFVIAFWNPLLAPLTGLELPFPLTLAFLAYIGISYLLQWRIKYGGCEVVAFPIILFKRRYTTYCIPVVAVDAIEKVVVDKKPE